METDYLFVKPVASPGPAESGARALGFFYDYVYADAPRFRVSPHAADLIAWSCGGFCCQGFGTS